MDTEAKFSPPYNIPWTTFLSTVERIAEDPPTRVDRSYLGSQSGNTQTYLIAALKNFGLISEDAVPTGVLEFADPASRPGEVADLLRTFYPTIVPLGTTNSTSGHLTEAFTTAFPNIAGESRVKAIRFFLGAMAYAELPTAPLWGTVKAARGSSAKKTTRKPKPAEPTGSNGAANPATEKGEVREISFGEAGTVVVTVNVKWLDLPDKTFADLRKLIKDIEALQTGASGGKSSPHDEPEPEPKPKPTAPPATPASSGGLGVHQTDEPPF